MKSTTHMLCLLILLIILGVASCGGGGSELAGGGGIGGTGVVSSGVVTEFGSVWVNGTRFDTRDAELYFDDAFLGSGDQAVRDNLDIGRVVRVSGRLYPDGSAIAESVWYSTLLSGPIEAIETIDADTMVFVVLGQRIIVDRRTVLKDLSLDDLTLENLVEVSGFFNGNGEIEGTFYAKQADGVSPDAIFRITGPVSQLDAVNRTFYINARIIDYSQVPTDSPTLPVMEDGMLVAVTGRPEDSGTVFYADTLSEYQRLGDIQTEHIEIEGVIGSVLPQNQFYVEGYLVEATPDTNFSGGKMDDLLNGVSVEVKGRYSAGTLIAEKIKFGQIFRVESDLAGKDSAESTLTLVALDGLTINTNVLTRFSGQAHGFEQLNPGDHLVIKGWPMDDQTISATQIIKRPAVQDKVVLRGIITLINNPTILISNVAINTDEVPEGGFFEADDTPLSREKFFNQIQQGDWVEIRGELPAGNSVVWNSITLVRTE